MVENIVACQGGRVSIKSRRPSSDKGHTLPFSPLNRCTILASMNMSVLPKPICYAELDLIIYIILSMWGKLIQNTGWAWHATIYFVSFILAKLAVHRSQSYLYLALQPGWKSVQREDRRSYRSKTRPSRN